MDKLIQKTVYVPVARETNSVLKKGGLDQVYLQEHPNVYPLTGQQLEHLFEEYHLSHLKDPTSFLKSKGVKI